MKRKRILSLFMVAAMSISLLAGCGNGGDKKPPAEGNGGQTEDTDADKPSEEGGSSDSAGKTLRMMTYVDPSSEDPAQAKIHEVYERFTEDTGIEIEYEIVPWDQSEAELVIANQGGNAPDIALISSQKLASLVNAGALASLDEYIDKDMNRDDFVEAVWNAGTYSGDGQVYCMLSSAHTRGIWYNKNYVSDEEAPDTWDDVVQVGKKVMEENENVYGFGFWGGSHYAAVELTIGPMTWAGDGALSNPQDGSAAWANQQVADAIQFMSDCYNVHKITPEICMSTTDYSTDVTQQFAAGNIAMILDGSYIKSRLEASDNAGNFGFVPYPAKTEGGSHPHFSNGWAWGIPRNAEQPELAWEFIKWFSQTDIQVAHSLVEGGLPIVKAAADDPAFSDDLSPLFFENLAHGRSMDPWLYYQEAQEKLAIAGATYCLDPENEDLNALLQKSQDEFNEQYYSE